MDALQVGKLTSTKKMLCIDTVICFLYSFYFMYLLLYHWSQRLTLSNNAASESELWRPSFVFCRFVLMAFISHVFSLSVFWRCWLGGRNGIQPVKKLEWWCANMVTCLEQGADLHIVQLMPLPLAVFCFSKIRTKGRWTGVCLLRLLVNW